MKILSTLFTFWLFGTFFFSGEVLVSKAALESPVRLSETLKEGKTLSLNLNSSNWQLSGTNNPEILTVALENSNLSVKALKPGLATAYACPTNLLDPSVCAYVIVTVMPENVLGINTAGSPAPHSARTWVNVGQTVFYVHEHGLIPITTYQIFLSVAPKNVTISPANDYDMQLPLLPFMETNDQRVQK